MSRVFEGICANLSEVLTTLGHVHQRSCGAKHGGHEAWEKPQVVNIYSYEDCDERGSAPKGMRASQGTGIVGGSRKGKFCLCNLTPLWETGNRNESLRNVGCS